MKNILSIIVLFVFATNAYSQAPCPGTPTVNYEGKSYNTVKIKNQCWLKENLDVGKMIPAKQASTNNNVIEKYCYNDLPANCDKYGGLYQWDEMMQYVRKAGSKGICPSGWHVPTRAEFQVLAAAVNNNGNALKRADQGRNGGIGKNTSGFSMLLGGYNYNNIKFEGYTSDWWSNGNFQTSTEVNNGDAYYTYVLGEKSIIGLDSSSPKTMGYSVRCIKD